ncbi:MAG TPA: hypothetical protein VH165_04680 [Kofleriaceae bacterium]|nr:hypothetical protein [Kofleriaceae bacterium]
MGIFDRLRGGTVRIQIRIQGRSGADWCDVDEGVRVPAGTTLGQLLEITDAAKLPLRAALEHAPQLTETMTLNGERCPFGAHAGRVLAEGDRIQLVSS